MLMDPMESTYQVSGDIFQHPQPGLFLQSNLFYQSPLHIPNKQSYLTSNSSFSLDARSSNYMIANQHSFSLTTMEEMALTRAMLSAISSSKLSSSSSSATTTLYQRGKTDQNQANYCLPMSSFQSYSSSKLLIIESHKILQSQNMIKKVHNMLRSVSMLNDEGKVEETQPNTYQMQHMVSERKRREKLNASFHSLWQLLSPGSKKDKASVLCKTVSYVKSLQNKIYELEVKNRVLEEKFLSNIEVEEKSIRQSKKVEVQISKSSETLSAEFQQIELAIIVRVQCDLIRVVLRVLECIKAMKVISLLSLDTMPNSNQTRLLATLKLAIEESTWDERTFKEAIAAAAHMALTTNG